MLAEEPPMGPNPDFPEVFLRFCGPVFKFFRRYRFTEDESNDLTQETFLRVYKGWTGFRGEAQLKTWILQIARHIALNEFRKRSALKRDGAEVSLEESTQNADDEGQRNGIWARGDIDGTPLQDALKAERRTLLCQELLQLPPQMRRCVQLRVHEDLKYREIAEILGISIETVKAHLFQARQKLKEKLSDYYDSGLDSLL